MAFTRMLAEPFLKPERLAAYEAEICAVQKLDLSFEEWQNLKPLDTPPSDAIHPIYIIPTQPIDTKPVSA